MATNNPSAFVVQPGTIGKKPTPYIEPPQPHGAEAFGKSITTSVPTPTDKVRQIPLDQKIFEPVSRSAPDARGFLLDRDWARQSFMLSTDAQGVPTLDPIDIRNRTFSTVSLKFTDTSLGGNYAINAKPQFTRYADTRSTGRLGSREEVRLGSFNGRLGMGRYYSEAIDDNAQIIHMRFGVPSYNSLTQFFSGFYNSSAGRLARTGRTTDFFHAVGFLVGAVFQIRFYPLLALNALGFIARFFFGAPTSRFYYLKPTMAVYWGAVNSMVNKIAVGKGLFPMFLESDENQTINKAYKLDPVTLKNLHTMMPNIISADGGFDIYAAASRAERMRIQADNLAFEKSNQPGADTDFTGFVKKESQEKLVQDNGILGKVVKYRDALQLYLDSEGSQVNKGADDFERDIKAIPGSDPNSKNKTKGNPLNDPNNPDKTRTFLSGWWNYLKAEFNDGAAFATFRVDYTGPIQESFANSVRDSDIASKLNGISSGARSMSFSFAGGSNIGGAVGKVADFVTGGVKSFLGGALDSIGAGGLIGLGAGAFVDIPKHWESSSAQLPRSQYTMTLSSPYGNVISQMQNIYIPLSMILAGALPLSTGKQSYTSPFICELWDKGRHQTRLGMIENVSITRGTSNLGFNKDGKAMAVEVSFSIVDMSSVMHMQIAKGFFQNEENGVFDDESVFSDYMNTLAGVSLHQQFHMMPKLKLRLARTIRNLQSLGSAAAWAQIVNERTPVSAFEIFFKGTSR